MAEQALINAILYFGGYDISGNLNRMEPTYGAEMLDVSSFGDESRRRLAGLLDFEISGSGWWQGGADGIDEILWGKIASEDEVLSFAPSLTDGGRVFMTKVVAGEYAPGAAIGDALGFSFAAAGRGVPLVGGTIMATGAKTVSGNGTARQLGAVASGERLYASLHVIAASGTTPTLDVKVQSDDSSDFLTPTDRIIFSQTTGIGAQWATPVDGAITDDWWRVVWTIGGTAPGFTILVNVGIQ